jgi:hypothetical protein
LTRILGCETIHKLLSGDDCRVRIQSWVAKGSWVMKTSMHNPFTRWLRALFATFLTILIQGTASAQTFAYSGSETNITLNPGTYDIMAFGAAGGWVTIGGKPGPGGGYGAEMEAEFNFTGVTTLTILVGSLGANTAFCGAGGGGGSFVVDGSTPLIIAGGGGGGGWGGIGGPGSSSDIGGSGSTSSGTGYGGSGSSGGGGGGFYSAGGTGSGGGGSGYFSGGAGGAGSSDGNGDFGGNGGYGGGGGGGVDSSRTGGGGGGGGYSGGTGGSLGGFGGLGGGSYIDSSTAGIGTELSGVQSGSGLVEIEAIPEPSTWAMVGVGLSALPVRRRRKEKREDIGST